MSLTKRALDVSRHAWPMWLVAVSLNGFFVYLAILDAIDVEPRTPLTATYYALLGGSLLATAWYRRRRIGAVLRGGRGPVAICAGAATILACWFLLNSAMLSDGPLARRLAGLLVLWTVPTALVVASFQRTEITSVAHGLIALGLLFLPIETVAIARAGGDVFRFTPVTELDVISAGLIPALGAVAALSLEPTTMRRRVMQLGVTLILVAAAVVPGSRGPVLALLVASVTMVLFPLTRFTAVALAVVALGIAAGSAVGSEVGSFGYLSSGQDEEISTLSIRQQWIEDALSETRDEPVFGHGVGMFEDNTPEARIMGVEGQRTYPHNTLVEAAHALGLVGLTAFVAFIAGAIASLIQVVRASVGRDAAVALAVGIGTFALVNTNISGEIGSDALLWSAAALTLALYADRAGQAGILPR